MLETATGQSVPHYMPLFVRRQPSARSQAEKPET